MILTKNTPYTRIDLWYPKYSTQYDDIKQMVFLPACYKVDDGAPVIVVEFTRAKHMQGLRYAMKRSDIMKHPIQSNGKIPCYIVPKSHWEKVETLADVLAEVDKLFAEDV